MNDQPVEKRTSDEWPKDGLETVGRCPICGGGERETLYSDLVDQVFSCAPGVWTLHRCGNCGCAFLDPRPTEDTIHIAYEQYYTHAPSAPDSTSSLGPMRKLIRALANGYRNWHFGTSYRPASRLGLLAGWIIPGMRGRLQRQFRGLPRPSENARLLDVGFGDGIFLELARDAGWEVAGADPDPVSVAAAREQGFDVRQGGIDAFADSPAFFDVITLSHVIEHVHDPIALMNKVYALLKPGGIVWLETPNIDSIGHARFGRFWLGLEPPRHLQLLNWHAVESILGGAGFTDMVRFPAQDEYLDLSAKSRGMAAGKDPYQYGIRSVSDYISYLVLRLRLLIDHRQSEFITVAAVKPGSSRGTS